MNWKTVNKIFLAFIAGIVIGYHYPRPSPETPNPKIIMKDSLVRDSIIIINDSIKKEIIYLEKKYNEETSTIMSNSDSINFEWFSDYIKRFNQDFIGTVENSKSDILGTQEILRTDSVVKSTNN